MGVGTSVGVGDTSGVGVLVAGGGVAEGSAATGAVERLTIGAGRLSTGLKRRWI